MRTFNSWSDQWLYVHPRHSHCAANISPTHSNPRRKERDENPILFTIEAHDLLASAIDPVQEYKIRQRWNKRQRHGIVCQVRIHTVSRINDEVQGEIIALIKSVTTIAIKRHAEARFTSKLGVRIKMINRKSRFGAESSHPACQPLPQHRPPSQRIIDRQQPSCFGLVAPAHIGWIGKQQPPP